MLAPPEAGKSTRGGLAWGELAQAQEEEKCGTPATEMAQPEPMRCGFGAVRVGALLGRLRLHLQTDRFLAVHRGDGVWESACVAAALTLAEIVETMSESALDAPLAPRIGPERRAQELPRAGTPPILPASLPGAIPSPPRAEQGSAVGLNVTRTADSSGSFLQRRTQELSPGRLRNNRFVSAPDGAEGGAR